MPKVRERRGKVRTSATVEVRDLRRLHKIKSGTLSQVIDNLSLEQAQWLFEQTPAGWTLAEMIALIIRDTYAEEVEDE